MRGVARTGRTVIFVTHDLAAVAALTDRAICLDAGRIIASGSTSDVVGDYLARGVGTRDAGQAIPLSERPRPEGIAHSDAVRLDWVRTAGHAAMPSGTFTEGESIGVEFGFTVERTVADLEFVLGVASLDRGVVVFHDRSPRQARPVVAGNYVVGMRIAPNPLRAGAYSLGLKVFADGTRADSLHDAVRFVMIESAARGGRNGEYMNHDGLLRTDYSWDAITPQMPFDAFPYTEDAPEDVAEEVGSPR
jgi:lipopolysaccharide transport system ATP-binding protein